MREMKFRGKVGGMWTYATLPDGWVFIGVNPETIGQYTGLKDRNGKEIYEGDLLLYTYPEGSTTFQVKIGTGTIDGGEWDYTYYGIYLEQVSFTGRKILHVNPETGYGSPSWAELEIIGNICDNPE